MREKQAIKDAFSELSSRYEDVVDGELNDFWGWNYSKFVDELISRTTFHEKQTILDIATGTSAIPRKIMKLKIPGLQITGLDITESMLRQGKRKITAAGHLQSISLTCGDAMALPFSDDSFDVVVSGLASHHMNIPTMLAEMRRVIKPGGVLSIIDVGTSPVWEKPLFKGIARLIAFVYFLIKENPSRAWAEAAAVSNLRTPEGWQIDLQNAAFHTITIKKLQSKYRWAPEPLSIQSLYIQEEK